MIGSCSHNQQEQPFRRRGTQYVTHDWITFKISLRHFQMEPKTIWILIIINMSCVIDLADPLPTRPLLLRLVQSAFCYFFSHSIDDLITLPEDADDMDFSIALNFNNIHKHILDPIWNLEKIYSQSTAAAYSIQ